MTTIILWQGIQDSNLCMAESKSAALPTWRIPNKTKNQIFREQSTTETSFYHCLSVLSSTFFLYCQKQKTPSGLDLGFAYILDTILLYTYPTKTPFAIK